jgi:hypothetical protein
MFTSQQAKAVVRFWAVFTVYARSSLSWVVTQRRLIFVYRYFGTAYLHLANVPERLCRNVGKKYQPKLHTTQKSGNLKRGCYWPHINSPLSNRKRMMVDGAVL